MSWRILGASALFLVGGMSCSGGSGTLGQPPPCAAVYEECEGRCVDLASDVKNCGGCGTTCLRNGICSAGRCACPAGSAACGNECADVSSDENHCGQCGEACPRTQTCSSGQCGCALDQTPCGDQCVDVLLHPNHCGRCDNACARGIECIGGECDPSCTDTCPHPNGITWGCRSRFMLGMNYAWRFFGADFGGIPRFTQPGVSQNLESVRAELADMADGGVNVVRWWIWPDFRSDGVRFDAAGTPIGLGGTALADLDAALELAAEYDLRLMLTLFSFDAFKSPDPTWNAPHLKPVILDPAKRTALIENVVRPFARAAWASPHRNRLLAWDVMNEPEWAIKGESKYLGDEPFTPNEECDPVTHAQMEAFFAEVISALRQESDALTSVGSAAMKWKSAWSALDLDFHQFHIYGWINGSLPYSRSPAEYALTDKPVLWGEFPHAGFKADNATVPLPVLLESWFTNGYAGALSWSYTDAAPVDFRAIREFAARNSCQTRY